jgi:hypothetical protein
MENNMKDKLIKALKSHAQGHIDKHVANVEIMLNNPVGIGEHGDVMEEIEKELEEVAKYNDIMEMVDKYLV